MNTPSVAMTTWRAGISDGSVCVVIPTFNGERHVARALDSVLAEHSTDLQVIAVDAGSSDATVELLAEKASVDPRVTVMRATHRLTAPQARNAALEACRSEFLLTLDQDDEAVPHRIRCQVRTLKDHPQLVAVGGGLSSIDEQGTAVASTSSPRRSFTDATLGWELLTHAPTMSSAMAYRTRELKSRGGFDVRHPLCDDYALLHRLSRQPGSVLITAEVVGRYRRHSGQLSRSVGRRQRLEADLLRQRIMWEVLGQRPPLDAIAALVRPSPFPESRAAAVKLGRELLTRYLDQTSVTPTEQEWIEARAAALMEPPDRRSPGEVSPSRDGGNPGRPIVGRTPGGRATGGRHRLGTGR